MFWGVTATGFQSMFMFFLPETKPLNYIEYLVGGLEPWNFMTFHLVANVIIPSEELHHFSEG